MAKVTCRGFDANKQQIIKGLAMVNKNYSSDYLADELKAKKNKVGLWSQEENDILSPSDYRAMQNFLNIKL
ncbi:MAG: thermonuclease family protein [Campylobacteraceae bacterium]|nr:thermonuclease family protein [Campylobacteraceae bacterium]